MHFLIKKMQKYLVNSKKSSTFAPAFGLNARLFPLSGCKSQSVCSPKSKRVSLAQLVEQLTLNQWVESSSLSGDT